MLRPFLTFMLLGALGARAEPAPAREKLAVLRLVPNGVDTRVTDALLNALVSELARDPQLEIVSARDIADMLDVEQKKQLVGCESSSCLVELGGALGAARVVTGSVDRLGNTLVFSAQVIDVANAKVLRRASERLQGEDELLDGAARVAAALRGAEPPPPSTRAPETDPSRRLTLELGTDLPLALGFRVRKAFAPGLTLALGLGVMPTPYTSVLAAASVASGRMTPAVGRLIESVETAPAAQLQVGWDFGAPRGWRAELGAALVSGDVRVTAGRVRDASGVPLIDGLSPTTVLTSPVLFRVLTACAGYEWAFSPGFSLTGTIGLVAGIPSTGLSFDSSLQRVGLPNDARRAGFSSAVTRALEPASGGTLSPLAGIAVGYEP